MPRLTNQPARSPPAVSPPSALAMLILATIKSRSFSYAYLLETRNRRERGGAQRTQ